MLTDEDRRFLTNRAWRNRIGWPAMLGATAIWIGLWVWFVVRVPLLANPLTVARRLQAGDLDRGTEVIMAAMCPVLFDVVGLLMVCFLVFTLSWVRVERRYLQMLRAGGCG
jgi:hypothetical protein